jgi:hypothetical protein
LSLSLRARWSIASWRGIDPDYGRYLENAASGILASAIGQIVDKYVRVRKDRKKQILNDISELAVSELQDFFRNAEEYRRNNFVDPIIRMASLLPKQELAHLAESLVNLTSLKRRVSLDDESVGGPIDVAVISKGDGLIWIKRKHYFDQVLNQTFMANYFRNHVAEEGETGRERVTKRKHQ